jgi:hypothetical protein
MTTFVIKPAVLLVMTLPILSVLLTGCSGGGGYGSSASVNYSYSISGTIIGGATDNSGVTVSLTGGTAAAPVTTMAGGSYSFTGLANGVYTVTPSRTGYTFTPASSQVTIYGGNMTTNFAEAP